MTQAFIETIDWLDATYEALSRNDIDLFLTSFAADARWNVVGAGSGLPFAGQRTGHLAIREIIGLIYSEFRIRDFFIEDIIANEGSAAVRWSALATSIATGRATQIEVFDHLVIRGRLILSVTQFLDTASVASAAGKMRPVMQETPGE